jgi:hypothetical protein
MRRTVLLAVLLLVASSFAAAPPTRQAPKEPEKPKGPSPRLQRLQQLVFDRRPSAILKAWAPKGAEKVDLTKIDSLTLEMDMFQRRVTLGRWDAVKAYLAVLPKDEAKAAYQRLLQSLQQGPQAAAMIPPGKERELTLQQMMQMAGPGMAYAEKNQISPDDLVGIATASPEPLEREALESLAGVVRACLAGGTVVEAIVGRFKQEVQKPKGALTARQAARLVAAADRPGDNGDFLPPEEKARADKDLEALNLLVRHYMAQYERDKKLAWLEKAWSATQAVLAVAPDAKQRQDQEDALKLAVELAPRVKEELGERWLEESFTKDPARGMTILSTIGGLSSQALFLNLGSAEPRLKLLKLQKTAVEALLKASPERAKQWRDTLTLLARNWMREADVTYQFAQDHSARMRRDRYGNIFWWEDYDFGPGRFRNQQQPTAIEVVETLLVRPSRAWLEGINAELRPKLAMLLCQLHLKADEEKEAFPNIEDLSHTHPRKARELANEFLTVWTRNHDPNASRGYRNRYMYWYGFETRAEGIPLTRSKQERNLVELAEWVARLKELPIGDLDEELLAKAFTACHSSAEVYKAEAIEKVFGPIGGLKPKVLSGLAQQMRGNLAGVWRRPEEQKDKKTNRRTKDIQQEVRRGYAVALATVDQALKKFPDDWSLVQARAAILHDEVNFLQELQKSSDYTAKRLAAFKEFERACRLYAAKAKDYAEEDQTTKPHEQWLYASLGAVDAGQITEEKVSDPAQPAKIRATLLALPGELATKHMDRFANQMFKNLSAVKPQVKYTYLKAAFGVVGDNKHALEARKVFDYYKDLVGEIKLETKIDGPSAVGHKQPFGVFVLLRHTRDIERESGGFGRYLQNQNTGTSWSWNYGRPTVDYRDRFQTAVTEALKEHFEVLSVTFETDKVHSRATAEYGWRVTPYAYLLLKPRGPQVDKMPPLKLDLDFLDTSGYVVLPVESPTLPLDARAEKGEPRPARKLEITQTLDERQAKDGKLILEVKATAQGLVPDLERLVRLDPEGFEVKKIDDQGVSVSKFDPDSDQITIDSERTWLVTLRAKEGLAKLPTTFTFAEAKEPEAKLVYQRYDDADLAKVEATTVQLERSYGKRGLAWLWWAGGGALALLAAAGVAWRKLRNRRPADTGRWKLPQPLTPFTAIALLERIHKEAGLSEAQRDELTASIRRLERHYFAATNGEADMNLREVAQGWIQRAG